MHCNIEWKRVRIGCRRKQSRWVAPFLDGDVLVLRRNRTGRWQFQVRRQHTGIIVHSEPPQKSKSHAMKLATQWALPKLAAAIG